MKVGRCRKARGGGEWMLDQGKSPQSLIYHSLMILEHAGVN